ncbi:MAG TPA: hypothetical protein VIK65_05000 [Candidatus Limnocylindrales bacterium]
MSSRHVRVYGALLRLYPRTFRQGYRHEMTVLFAQQLEDARATDGTVGVLRLWARSLADVVATAPAEHLEKDALVAQPVAGPDQPASATERTRDIAWNWITVALAPGLVALVMTMGQPGWMDPMFSKPPEAMGFPLGFVIMAGSAIWYAIGVGLIARARHRAVRLVGVFVFVLPATLAFLLGPAAILILQNLAAVGSD